MKNTVKRAAFNDRKKYKRENINDKKLKWKYISSLEGNEYTFPTSVIEIKIEEKQSLRKLTWVYASHFESKLSNAMKTFNNCQQSETVEIMSYIIDKPEAKYFFKKVAREDMYTILKESKPRKTVGVDLITSNILKQIPNYMPSAITHL